MSFNFLTRPKWRMVAQKGNSENIKKKPTTLYIGNWHRHHIILEVVSILKNTDYSAIVTYCIY